MGEGGWVLLGSVLGYVASLANTWLSAQLARQSKYPKFDKAVEALLRQMLQGGLKWRKLETLARVTGLSEQDAKEYLIEIGARGSEKGGDLWGLVERNPLTDIQDA